MKITRLPNGMGVIKLDIDKAEELASGMMARYTSQVGILGSKAANRAALGALSKGGGHKVDKKKSSDLTNAEIGFMHEKGVFAEENGHLVKKTERRSFLEMPIVNNARYLAGEKNDLKTAVALAVAGGADVKSCWRKACGDLGKLAEQVIQKAFEQHGPGWAPNAASTIAKKGSDSPLIDSGQLRRSISSRVVSK